MMTTKAHQDSKLDVPQSEVNMPIDDVRASARYRRLLVEALVPRALERCLLRIREAQT